MKLGDYLNPGLVLPDLSARSKEAVLAEMVEPLARTHPDIDRERAVSVLLERERLGTTGIGDGIAIPHGKIEGLSDIVLVAARCCEGIDFDALDHRPCQIFFLVLAPEEAAGQHLRVLAHISRLLKDSEFKKAFLSASDKESLLALLQGV
ncbi:putative PTS IIA-like nitrogen-regulatory protein PtsN [Desulfovibrio sp. X2]|uniref:PTS sugar transporter subunit IIA n=1 Tax=Desulfovibrio sp. X2 TaxID=941449 RepID=UPI000358DD2A|nr:PTS sugar transporter subunit IIA [Desulfovibrio sp. X2]EPR42201.1 putative PTS IIA-like nitrogen-regulatory protein PtsN [Desulfovibrio sp. X2]